MQLLFTKERHFQSSDLKCCKIEVIQKIVYVNKETGFSVVMLHYPTFVDFKEDRAEVIKLMSKYYSANVYDI